VQSATEDLFGEIEQVEPRGRRRQYCYTRSTNQGSVDDDVLIGL
jgi:hypothetical protein